MLVNEINTIPGMTAMSAFPRLWEATGLSGRELIDEIVQLGLRRHAARAGLLTTHQRGRSAELRRRRGGAPSAPRPSAVSPSSASTRWSTP